MALTKNQQILDGLVSTTPSKWESQARFRQENKAWLRKSSLIATKVLTTLRRKGLSQKALADMLGCSAQYINKLVSGKENLTLETIARIEGLLGVELIAIPTYTVNIEIPQAISHQPAGFQIRSASVRSKASMQVVMGNCENEMPTAA